MQLAYLKHSFFVFLDSKRQKKKNNKLLISKLNSVSFQFRKYFEYYVFEHTVFSYFCFLNFKYKINFSLEKNFKLNLTNLI